MGIIGYLILFAIIFIMGKFIYDSYLTGNTEKEWSKYNKDKEYNNSLKEEVKPGIDSIQLNQSRRYLAKQFNCNIKNLENEIINDLKKR